MTQQEIAWTPWDEPGIEHLVVSPAPDGSVSAESVVLGLAGRLPFAVRYRIEADADWRIRRLSVDEPYGGARIDLLSGGDGRWRRSDGTLLSDLDGCIDVDIAVTPFTNTLPIRRLKLQQGESREIAVVYVSAPSLELSVEMQRYTCLDRDRRYRFESLDGGFTDDLPVDEEGIVLDYPGLFRRVSLRRAANH